MTPFQSAVPPLGVPHTSPVMQGRVGGYDRYGNPQDTLTSTPGAPASEPRSMGRVVQRPERRSVAMAVCLAGVFGPLGLLYTSRAGALVTSALFTILTLPVVAFWWKWVFIAAALTAPVCVVWALVASLGHNARLAWNERRASVTWAGTTCR